MHSLGAVNLNSNTMLLKQVVKPFFAVSAIVLGGFLTGCDDDENVSPDTVDTTVYPMPDDAFGHLIAIKTFSTVEVGGFTTDVEFGTAVAVFPSGGSFQSAGTITANEEELTKNANNSYVYIPDFASPSAATGITFGSEARWSVAGEGSVPAISKTYAGFPSKPVITSATTVDRSAGYTFTWNSISGADSLIATIFSGNGETAMKTIAGSATSASFSSGDLSGLGATDFGFLQVAAYKQMNELVSGQKIYYTNQSATTKTGVTIE